MFLRIGELSMTPEREVPTCGRRLFLFKSVLAAGLAGCTKSVTKYRADGTPYTVEEDDWVATLAAVILALLAIGAIAVVAGSNSDDSSSNFKHGRRKSRVRLVMMITNRSNHMPTFTHIAANITSHML